MHVYTPQHWWKKQRFFREKQWVPEQYFSMGTDEPIHEPLEHDGHEFIPATQHDSIPESGTGKEPKPKLKTKKTRRGWGAKGKKSSKFTIFGNNANGLKAKQDSLINTLKNLGSPSCVLIQETKLRHQGTFKLKGYQIFEKIRGGQGVAFLQL